MLLPNSECRSVEHSKDCSRNTRRPTFQSLQVDDATAGEIMTLYVITYHGYMLMLACSKQEEEEYILDINN